MHLGSQNMGVKNPGPSKIPLGGGGPGFALPPEGALEGFHSCGSQLE